MVFLVYVLAIHLALIGAEYLYYGIDNLLGTVIPHFILSPG
jgi:hypothetical protein